MAFRHEFVRSGRADVPFGTEKQTDPKFSTRRKKLSDSVQRYGNKTGNPASFAETITDTSGSLHLQPGSAFRSGPVFYKTALTEGSGDLESTSSYKFSASRSSGSCS